MFFVRFNFTVTYLPGSKNIKADALSREFEPPAAIDQTVPILAPSCFTVTISWTLEETLWVTNKHSTPPSGYPPGWMYVPT